MYENTEIAISICWEYVQRLYAGGTCKLYEKGASPAQHHQRATRLSLRARNDRSTRREAQAKISHRVDT